MTNINEGLFIVILWNKDDANFEPAASPRVYKSYKQARKVAYVMAERYPNDTFVVFRVMGQTVRNSITFEEM